MNSTITIAHISDLHFSSGAYREGKHQHSIPRLKGIQEILSKDDIDLLIVSGDITNGGDPESLLRAHNWLFGSFPIDGVESIGLGLEPGLVGVIPGNHDAFNDDSGGFPSLIDCWQKSLANYNAMFQHHQFVPPDSCRYQLIEKDGRAVFLVYADTSFVGDPELEKATGIFSRIPKVARGKFRREQSEQILGWFQLGIKGKLHYSNDPSRYIPAELFANSLKILVAHHYLFEPKGRRIERLLHVKDARSVFVNIASADFDMYLCGHKHIDDQDPSTYGKRLDRRGKRRHLLNLFRRSIGIDMLPLRFRGDDGKSESLATTLFLTVLYIKEKLSSTAVPLEEESDGQFVDGFVAALQSSLQDPTTLERQVSSFLKQYKIPADELLHSEELREIQRRLRNQFTAEDLQQLKVIAKKIERLAKQLSSRPFVQIMAGSAAKETAVHDKKRSFNLYRVKPVPEGFNVRVEHFFWDRTLGKFSENPEVFNYSFEDSHRSILT